jgi:hypothetical protein
MNEFMDEQAIKVRARFVEVGQYWPKGAWVHVLGSASEHAFYRVTTDDVVDRRHGEICEIEANQKGIFRHPDVNYNHFPNILEK